MIRRWLLKRSIKKNGVLVPIIVTEDGVILDGTNRLEIAKQLGINLPVAYVTATLHKNVNPNEIEEDD